MDIKVYDEKVNELQNYLPFLGRFVTNLETKNGASERVEKFKRLYKLIESTKRGQRIAIETLVRVENAIREIRKRCDTKALYPSENVTVKKEAADTSDKTSSVCESVSETPDSPSPTRHYERTSPIEIPTERSDDRDNTIKKEKDSHRYEDNRRNRHDHQRSERPAAAADKHGSTKYDGADRNRSRYDQHETFERSRSRDRYRSDRRERSNSSERSRHGKSDRNRSYRHDDNSRDSWKKYDHRPTDRVIKTERSDRHSPSGQRDSGRPSRNLENEFPKYTIAKRFEPRPVSATVGKSPEVDRFTTDEVSEMMAKNRKLYGCDSDDEVSNELKSLTEVRSKLATQMKLAETMRKKEKPSTSTAAFGDVAVPEMGKMSLNAPIKKMGSRFELSSLRECTPTPPLSSGIKENSNHFSFLRTLSQSKAVETVPSPHLESKHPISIDDDLINKVVALPMQSNRIITPVIQDMNLIKQALETAKNQQQRLALKYNPKAKPRPPERIVIPETTIQSQQQQQQQQQQHHQPDPSHPNNLQVACMHDPRLSVSRARDPRVQQDVRMQPFSPPTTPPCMSNYPPIMQSSSGYKPNSYQQSGLIATPNHFASQQNAYHSVISPPPQHQVQSNLIAIPPHASTFNNHRNAHPQVSPVSSSDIPPSPRYQYQAPSFPDHNSRPSGIHSKFRPSLNDNVERQKYEKSRNRRSIDYYDKEPPRETPSTYGEYRRLQANVSSTSEKSDRGNNESRSSANISTSHHDNVYRTGNYATPIPSVATQPTGSKFKIPKKSTNETVKSTHIIERCDSKDSEDEQSNTRVVKDSDDSEHEMSGKTVAAIAVSDCESSDIRDPRMRAQALRKSSTSIESKTKESADNNVVTSSTSLVPENVSTPDNIEFLKHLTNPNNMLALINLVGQMSDDQTFAKVKEVLEKAKENATKPAEETPDNLSPAITREKVDVPKTPRKKSKNELEKLNEDIRTMFISDGVLNATGRRVCALYNNNATESAAGGKNAKATKKQAKDDVAIEKKGPPENRITRRRNTMVCYTDPPARAIRPRDSDATKEPQPTTPETSKSTAQAPKTAPETAKKTTPESKKTPTPEQPAPASAKAVKAKKTPEPTDAAEEAPTKRITRAQMKECNIVLEKISPDASVESLTLAESPKKGKRRIEIPAKNVGAKRAKKNTVKNINPEFHSLKKLVTCQLCAKPAKLSIVNHYVTYHPKAEVVTSRLAPEVADTLRNMKVVKLAERFQPEGRLYPTYSHICYFCNVMKSMTKIFWMNHMAKHTGYYQYKCNDCARMFAERNNAHACRDRNNLSKVPQPQFRNDVLKGFICDLCNFVRFNRADIEKHLRCEHETTAIDQFKEVTFLNLPKRRKRGPAGEKEAVDEEDEEETADASEDEDKEIVSGAPKRQNLDTDSDVKDVPENPPKKVLRSSVVHAEAFISKPKEDDGLFDKDTMKLMKDMSFSASKDGECTVRSNRVKSIAEKLSERFNSVQEESVDRSCKPEEPKTAKTEPLDPMTCDEGITIVRVTASEDCTEGEGDTDFTNERMDTSNEIEKTSPASVTTSSRDNNCTPTEEFNDESDDNWESYSSDDSDDDSADATEESSVVIQRQPNNRKNVGIIDTIARLQQSISAQGTSTSVDGVEKLPDAVSSGDTSSVKDEANSEAVADPNAPITLSQEEVINAVKSIDGTTPSVTEGEKVPVTYETIVSEAMITETTDDVDRAGKAKECVSNGRSSGSSYSFNFTGTVKPTTQFGSQNSQNIGGSSSNADSTNNDVDMADISTQEKTLTRIDNIGYTRSPDGTVTFCCLIDDCGFETLDLTQLLYHISDHQIEWFGYCYTCNAQIETDQVLLMMEFKHMTTVHYSKNDEDEIVDDKANNAGKPTLIKCKVLPGDKLSTREAEIAAKAERQQQQQQQQQQQEQLKSSLLPKVETKFLKISNVKSLTAHIKGMTTADTKPKPMPLITNVMSLGASSREYKESDEVSLKAWGGNQTNKLQKNCKKMLRDICLYALYKCMAVNCAFTTANAEHMLTHLRNHENVSSEPSWLECAYCDIVADSCALLVRHVTEEHQSSIFQCPYCFYRSCAAFNVVVHLQQFHPTEKKSVLVCHGKPRMYGTEKATIEKSRLENIRPLRCTEDCNKITYAMDHFVKHMRSSPDHSDKFKCQFCGYNTLVSETSKHLLCHSVGVYECVYCHYGINDLKSIQNHMCNTHPSKLLYICVRLTRKDQVLSDEQLSSVESTLIFHLGQTVDNRLFQRCPFTDGQLSYMDPTISSNAAIEATVTSNPIPTTPTVCATPIGLNIASVTSISSDSFANPAETVTASNTGLMLSDVLSYKDLEKDYMHDDWDKYFATLPIAAALPKRKSSITQPEPVAESKKATTSSAASRTDLLQDEIDNAAYILVKGTGLEGRDLYRCSFDNCDEQSTDIFVFNVHLLKHSNAASNGFKCYHCSVKSKNIVGLKYHIKVHGIHRYFCYYCNYTSAIVNVMHKHMQDTHNKNLVNTIPLNPKRRDQNKDMFIVCPRGLRQDELNKFGIALINRNKRQLTSTKKFYSPDDMESLPRQAIFNSSISCQLCGYSTKVRTNMYRHLAGHKGEKSVPKIDPVNPVPCLDTGEKHFDKMINLACSSNDGKTLSSAQLDSTIFIPEGRRFVCNARNCQYQNISEHMLNRHLTTLHPNEENYKCPHCNSLICYKMDADKVISHLRMHESKIYKCPKCIFAHHIKAIVEKHKDDLHPGVSDPAMLITRDETTSNVPDGQPKVSKWKCNLCNDLFATQKLVHAHIQTSHSIKFQYQCDICSEAQSNNKTVIQEHINLKHPNEGSRIKVYYTKVECTENDNAPIWRRDDPNKIKHIRGILFEEENVRKTTTTTTANKRDQSEVKKKTSQKKRSDKPVVEQNSDTGDAPVIDGIASDQAKSSTEDSESNAIVIISDEDTADVEKGGSSSSSRGSVGATTTTARRPSSISNPIPSTSKNLLESGKRFMGLSATPIKPSHTVVRAEATSSGIKSKKESSLDKAYLCGRCCKFSDHTYALVREHQATAHPNVPCEVFMRNTNNDTPQNKAITKPLPDETPAKPKPKFADCINYVCNHCIFRSQQPTIIYKHWKENHKFPKKTTRNVEMPGLPFQFRVSRTFQCCYCRKSTYYKDLKVHCERNHPYESFALVNKLDPTTCAICTHEYSTIDTKDVIEHFKTSHPNLTSSEPTGPDYLTDEWIDELTKVLPREQVKCTQPKCGVLFFSKGELECHTLEKHFRCPVQFDSVPNDPIMYGCPDYQKSNCQKTSTDESELVTHIRHDVLQFQCKFCEKRFSQLEMIKVHHEIMHDSKDETYQIVDINENLHVFKAIKIIFPNGFVITKAEAKGTRYGVMDDIVKQVTELDNRDLENVRKQQEESEKTGKRDKNAKDAKGKVKDVKPSIVKKRIAKRSLSDSDSDEESKPNQRTNVTPRLRKKFKSSPMKTEPFASPELESPSTSDENTPLISLISRSSPSTRIPQRRMTTKPSATSPSSGARASSMLKRRMTAKPAAVSTKPLDSNSTAISNSSSDDNEPLQILVPFSNYGKKPERVDLTKLFIDIPYGTSSIKVSCDSFAKSFDINPKLRLRRCDKLLTAVRHQQ